MTPTLLAAAGAGDLVRDTAETFGWSPKLFLAQVIVDPADIIERCRFAARRQLLEVNREERPIVKGRHTSGDAVHAAGPGWDYQSTEERDQSDGG